MRSGTFKSVDASEPVGDSMKASADVALTNRVSPKKLLLSKWTAVHPERKEKHFLVTKVFEPEIEGQAIVEIELEAAILDGATDDAVVELATTLEATALEVVILDATTDEAIADEVATEDAAIELVDVVPQAPILVQASPHANPDSGL